RSRNFITCLMKLLPMKIMKRQLTFAMRFLNANLMIKNILLAITAIFFGITTSFGQDLEKKWSSQSTSNPYKSIEFKKGEFTFSNDSIQDLKGDYLYQNNLL